MITVYRARYKYKEEGSDLWKDFYNIYVINNLQANKDDIKEEIKLCVKEYKYTLEKRGCLIKRINSPLSRGSKS